MKLNKNVAQKIQATLDDMPLELDVAAATAPAPDETVLITVGRSGGKRIQPMLIAVTPIIVAGINTGAERVAATAPPAIPAAVATPLPAAVTPTAAVPASPRPN